MVPSRQRTHSHAQPMKFESGQFGMLHSPTKKHVLLNSNPDTHHICVTNPLFLFLPEGQVMSGLVYDFRAYILSHCLYRGGRKSGHRNRCRSLLLKQASGMKTTPPHFSSPCALSRDSSKVFETCVYTGLGSSKSDGKKRRTSVLIMVVFSDVSKRAA
jgi:hypothetical protein